MIYIKPHIYMNINMNINIICIYICIYIYIYIYARTPHGTLPFKAGLCGARLNPLRYDNFFGVSGTCLIHFTVQFHIE